MILNKLYCSKILEPRENSYIEFTRRDTSCETFFSSMLHDLGEMRTSRTFPSLCRVTMESAILNLETVATIQTLDCHGHLQVSCDWSVV